MEARAERLTERFMLHATRPRQRSTHAPMKARTAPTAMKTVPSGKADFCMNGAFAVYGTTIVGIPAPAIVGSPVSEKMLPVVPAVFVVTPVGNEAVIDVAPVVVASLVDSAVLSAVVSPVDVADVPPVVSPVVASVAEVAPVAVVAVASVAVARSGRSACA